MNKQVANPPNVPHECKRPFGRHTPQIQQRPFRNRKPMPHEAQEQIKQGILHVVRRTRPPRRESFVGSSGEKRKNEAMVFPKSNALQKNERNARP